MLEEILSAGDRCLNIQSPICRNDQPERPSGETLIFRTSRVAEAFKSHVKVVEFHPHGMVWLDGKPTLSKTLAWPLDDPDWKRQLRPQEREGWSVLDDQMLFWRAFSLSENRTVVYMANTTSARFTQADTIILDRVAELDYAAHRVAIVPDVGFATAQWRGTGQFLRERHCPAQASYGELSVLGPTVSLCVTSTDTIPPNWRDTPSAIHYCRLDYEAGYTSDLSIDLAAETIATWNIHSGDLRMIKIPQTRLGKILHSADFQYIGPHKIALASSLAFNPCGAVLYSFSANAEDEEEPIKFYLGQHTDPDSISNRLGRTSISTSGPIIVHDHDRGSRITIFKNELLSGDIPSFTTTRDPPGLREVFNHPNDARTLNFSLSGSPSVAETRVLVHSKDIVGRPTIFVLDFDQTLLASLLSKQPSERADWNAQLVDGHAQVKVVTRRFYCAVDGEVFDQEYPRPQRAPPEWEAHLDSIGTKDEDEGEDMDNSDDSSDSDVEALPSGVEYDEAPEEHRDPVPFGYVQTTLRLHGVTEHKLLAITRNAILKLPEPTNNGRVFYFD